MSALGRGLLVALAVAILSVVAELTFIFVMRLSDHRIVFTSFYAVVLFSGLMGFVPLMLSPSRVSSISMGIKARIFLTSEISLFALVAILASHSYMKSHSLTAPAEISLAGYSYVLILVLTLVFNFRRLKHEALEADGD